VKPGVAAAALVVDSRCTLGEGVVWCDKRRAVLWTDIEGARLWMHVPADGRTHTWTLPERLGSFALCESGALLLGLAKGLAFADLDVTADSLRVTRVAEVESGARTRINDGRADRSGNFVFGTLDEDFKSPLASFYQYSVRHGLRRLDIDRVIIANSICFSPDGGTMYFCDSPARRIMQCDYDAAGARVSHVREFADLAAHPGFPDGSTIDAGGNLWNAEWGSFGVRCYTPEGRLDRQIEVPAKNPSCVTFGGPNLDELFITTARQDMTPQELDAMPQAGGVYRVVVEDARGLAEPTFTPTTS
jgi:sugar lactone lactonase YvrE